MTIFVHTLRPVEISPQMFISVRPPLKDQALSPDDSALKVMTDLTYIRAITIPPNCMIDFAQEIMRHAGIRLLLVIDDSDDLMGLITARDINGEKPINIITQEKLTRDQIQVHQIMTPLSELDPLMFSEVEHATIRQIIEHLRIAGRQHAIVIDELLDEPGYYIRGIFSATHIGRLLGIDITADGHIQSFAEFEQLIA